MTPNFCPQCGNQLQQGVMFCGSCGVQLATGGATGGCPNCLRGDVGDGQFCRSCDQFLIGDKGVKAAGLGRRVGAYVLDIILFIITLVIGYIVWWLFTLSRGQTPGKQLLGIRVMRADGTPSDWGWTFIREFIVKGIAVGLANSVVGVASIIDLLWAFWDKDRQTIHDKLMKTVVVDDRELRSATPAELQVAS